MESEKEYIFVGFCPNAEIANRQDQKWIAEGRCVFSYFDSPIQLARFNKIMVGDTIVLKKIEKFGETMKLYRRGKVREIIVEGQILAVDWSSYDEIIEVPLMGCNGTVDIRSSDMVEKEMPELFWSWLHAGA